MLVRAHGGYQEEIGQRFTDVTMKYGITLFPSDLLSDSTPRPSLYWPGIIMVTLSLLLIDFGSNGCASTPEGARQPDLHDRIDIKISVLEHMLGSAAHKQSNANGSLVIMCATEERETMLKHFGAGVSIIIEHPDAGQMSSTRAVNDGLIRTYYGVTVNDISGASATATGSYHSGRIGAYGAIFELRKKNNRWLVVAVRSEVRA